MKSIEHPSPRGRSGAEIIQIILHSCLRADDQLLLGRLSELPEFVMRHEWLAMNPNPAPCDWDHFNFQLFGSTLRPCYMSAYDPAPGFSYRNTPEDHERRQRLTMLFGIPTYRSEHSWGDMLIWAVSFREMSLFSGLTDWIAGQKAQGNQENKAP